MRIKFLASLRCNMQVFVVSLMLVNYDSIAGAWLVLIDDFVEHVYMFDLLTRNYFHGIFLLFLYNYYQ